MKKISRRTLLKTGWLATTLSMMPEQLIAATRQSLFIPPLVTVGRGRPIYLGMQTAQKQFISKKYTEVWGFNGQYLGPTIRVPQGIYAKLIYNNELPQKVSITAQGLQTSGELLGGIGRILEPNNKWSPIIPITQPASTCWYHADTIATSGYQTYRGLAGMWIIEDEASKQLNIPQKYGINDIPLILQDVLLNANGEQLFRAAQYPFLGNRLLVNGQESPFLTIPRGWVRFRLLNASLSRGYELHFSDNRPLYLIATGLGFLPKAKEVNHLFISPGERLEILVDVNEGKNVRLLAGKTRSFFDKVEAFFTSDNELQDNAVLELRPEGLLSVFTNQPEFVFDNHVNVPKNIYQTRKFHIDVENGLINQRKFDPRKIDVNAKLETVERWILSSTSATGFTLQGARFIVESQNQKAIPQAQRSWQDTVWINGETVILVYFDNPSTSNYPFTFRAADFILANKGCIGSILVQPA